MDEIKKAAVVGTGFMGRSIALLCAQYGVETVAVDISPDQLALAKSEIERLLDMLVDKGKLRREEASEAAGNLCFSQNPSVLHDRQAVIEAVPEDLELKKKIIRQIESQVGQHALILSNTSGLRITDIASEAAFPGRIMGGHFFSPPTVMKLVELVRGERTTEETYQRTSAFIRQIGKEAVNSPELPGFIVNRLLIPMINEAAFLVMQGAAKEDVDQAMKLGANHKMGPLELGDFIGLDVVLAIMKNLQAGFIDGKYAPCPLISDMVSEGRLGRKTKSGFYHYEAG